MGTKSTKQPSKKLAIKKQTLKKVPAISNDALVQVAGGLGPVTRTTCRG